MEAKMFDMPKADVAWCPGCGNHMILRILKEAVAELEIQSKDLVMVSGIGQAAKTPHYIKANVFNGLHGRALPAATAIKASNPNLTVIAEGGDGDMYGEGCGHLIHTIRRNPNITNIVHNNMVYGLTRGQASPSTMQGFVTAIQPEGVFEEPFNPLAVAIALEASFVARVFCGDIEQTKEVFKKAIQHRGYALIDVFQPCVVFNKVNTFKWFRDNSYYIEESYDPTNKEAALQRTTAKGKFPLGILYLHEGKATFEDNLPAFRLDKTPLPFRNINRYNDLMAMVQSKTK